MGPVIQKIFLFRKERFFYIFFVFLLYTCQGVAQDAERMREMGVIRYTQGEYAGALEMLFTAARLAGDNDSLSGSIELVIGSTYFKTGEYSLAEKYYKQALKNFEKVDFQIGIAKAYVCLGSAHRKKGRYEKALTFHLKAMKMAIALQDSSLYHSCLLNSGIVYREMGDFDQALKNYNEVLQLKQVSKDTHGLIKVYNSLGFLFQEWQRYDRALEQYDRALFLSQGKGLHMISVIHENKAQLFRQMGDFEKAIKHKELHIQARDSLIDWERYELVSRLNQEFETERESLEAEINEMETSLQAANGAKNVFQWLGGGLLLLSLLLGWRLSKLTGSK